MSAKIFYVLIGLIAFANTAIGQTFEAEIKKAVELSSAGKSVEALAAMDRATTILWLRSPLTVNKAFFVTKKAKVFGEYDKRPDAVFAKGNKLLVYTEIIGYDWTKSGDLYKIDMIADVALKNSTGKVLWSQKEFGKFTPEKPQQFKKLYFNLSLGTKGVPAGNYIIEFTLIDKLRNQFALVSLPFEIQ